MMVNDSLNLVNLISESFVCYATVTSGKRKTEDSTVVILKRFAGEWESNCPEEVNVSAEITLQTDRSTLLGGVSRG